MKIPPPLIALAGAGAIYAGGLGLPWATLHLPGQQLAAAACLLAGLLLELHSVAAFVLRKTTITPLNPERASVLVTSGFYRFTRNPMYLGMALLLAAVTLWTGSLTGFVVVPLFAAILTKVQIKPEEAALERIFGDDYRNYKAKVRRWI